MRPIRCTGIEVGKYLCLSTFVYLQPKLVIVGDSTRVVTSTLDEITPIPADVLISLPTEKPDEDQ